MTNPTSTANSWATASTLQRQTGHVKDSRVRGVAAASSTRQPPAPQRSVQMDPVERTRKQMGYRNNWHRKQVDDSTQVRMASPLRQSPNIAIIGGGLSGLACATELARLGIRCTVFDTGEHGVGGRLATRSISDRSIKRPWVQQPWLETTQMRFDHAAQFFTVTDPRFQTLVQEWLSAGVVKVWEGPVGTLRQGGQFTPIPNRPSRYVAPKGMRSLAAHMAAQLSTKHADLVEVRRPMWVGKMQAEGDSAWRLVGEGRSQGVYDAVVIAHNGKCANRLVGNAGAPRVAAQLMGLRLSAIWALMVAFDGPVPAPFEGAFIQGSRVLSWAGNNTAKMGLYHPGREKLQCWTLFSTNAYGQANKVPQEAIPDDVQRKIATEMIAALAEALGVPPTSMPPAVFTRCQLWGAALPTNTPGADCILDPWSRVGVCGDWLLGSSMQAATVSGIELARKLAGLRGVPMQDATLAPFRVGLDSAFKPLRATEIGEFPH